MPHTETEQLFIQHNYEYSFKILAFASCLQKLPEFFSNGGVGFKRMLEKEGNKTYFVDNVFSYVKAQKFKSPYNLKFRCRYLQTTVFSSTSEYKGRVKFLQGVGV